VARLRLSSELSLRLNGVSSLGLRLDLPPVGPTIESRLASKIRSSGGASDRLPALIENQLHGYPSNRIPICIGTCFSGCPGDSCPRLAPQAVILRVCQRTDSDLHRTLCSSAYPATRLSACASIRLFGFAVDADLGLRRRLHLLACQRSGFGSRRHLILQPTVCFNSRLAPQPDSSGVPPMRPSACASVCIFWLASDPGSACAIA